MDSFRDLVLCVEADIRVACGWARETRGNIWSDLPMQSTLSRSSSPPSPLLPFASLVVMSADHRAVSPSGSGPVASGSRSGYTPSLKPGEELLPPSEQEKLLKRRARDYHRYWRIKEQKQAATQIAEDELGDEMDAVLEMSEALGASASASAPAPATVPADQSPDSSDSEDEDAKLHCLCQTIYDGERFMICCDRCDGWYHPECLKMKAADAKLVDMFICPRCEKTTPDRTTWKTACLRPSCVEPANPPLSRYCSDRCGILVAAGRLAKTKYASGKASAEGIEKLFVRQVKAARKREGMVVWTSSNNTSEATSGDAQTAFQQLCWNDADADSTSSRLTTESSREDEILHHFRRDLEALRGRKSKHSAALDLVMARHKLLQLAEDRLVALPPVAVDAAESASAPKKSKSKGAATKAESEQTRTQPRCGYDERLSWNDERFTEWMAGEDAVKILNEETPLDGKLQHDDGNDAMDVDADSAETSSPQPSICGTAKRKCKRHSDWSTTRGMDFEVERDAQTASLSRISEQETNLQTQIAELEATLLAKRTAQDARLALELAQGAAARRRGGAGG